MTVESAISRRFEFYPQRLMEVGYGEAASIGRNGLIGTDGLFSCVGVILLDEGVVSLAHFPAEQRFWVVTDDQGSGEKIRTFHELADLLFAHHGEISEDTQAVIVGGAEGISDSLIERLRDMLGQQGIRDIKVRGPHSQKVHWDLRVRQGEITVSARKRSQYLLPE